MAISVEAEDIAQIQAKVNTTFPLYSDPERAAIKAWGVHDSKNDISLPATFVVDAQGTIVYRYVGENPRDRPGVEDLLGHIRKSAGG